MKADIKLRPATSEEAPLLSVLATASKAYWGYSDAFMAACRDELTVAAADITKGDNNHIVAEADGAIAGFYGLAPLSAELVELDMLFVEPGYIGQGVGRTLIEHALDKVTRRGYKKLVIQGDPNARRFYIAAGGREVGEKESASIPGRFLPVFEICL